MYLARNSSVFRQNSPHHFLGDLLVVFDLGGIVRKQGLGYLLGISAASRVKQFV